MRKFPLITATFLGLALLSSLSACQDDGGSGDSMMDTTGDGDGDTGDGDGDATGDGDGDQQCFEQPAVCEQFVRCIGAILPDQYETVEGQYGVNGSCWCDLDNDKAQTCLETCFDQVETAIKNNPTVAACHENYCTIDQLDPEQPYGPVVNGACEPYTGPQGDPIPQDPIVMPLNQPGSYCAPKCSGLANACPESNQTSAQGTCYLIQNNEEYCASVCYVDPTVIGGTQCQCGATCQPTNADGEGNMRGICTFE
jgi:hypothetical protein